MSQSWHRKVSWPKWSRIIRPNFLVTCKCLLVLCLFPCVPDVRSFRDPVIQPVDMYTYTQRERDGWEKDFGLDRGHIGSLYCFKGMQSKWSEKEDWSTNSKVCVRCDLNGINFHDPKDCRVNGPRKRTEAQTRKYAYAAISTNSATLEAGHKAYLPSPALRWSSAD